MRYKAIVYRMKGDEVTEDERDFGDFDAVVAWARSFGVPCYNLFMLVNNRWEPVQAVPN